jgi:putative transposase
MARPLRIEFSGALYHVSARGNAQQDIYLTDDDRHEFLSFLQRACDRYQWLCHAYCLMSNHYHLLIETQAPNRRHKRVGHVFQGRYKGILIEKYSYLLELSR